MTDIYYMCKTSDEEIEKFAKRMAMGEDVSSGKDLEFYIEHQEKIQLLLDTWSALN